MYIFPITSRCFTTGWSLTQMNTGGIHSEFLGNFLNTACRTTARTARIRNKFTKQSSTSNCFPSGCFKFWLLRCLAQTTNKSPAESDRRLTDTAIGMPQWQSTQLQFAIIQKCKVLVSVSAASGYDSFGGPSHLCLSLCKPQNFLCGFSITTSLKWPYLIPYAPCPNS